MARLTARERREAYLREYSYQKKTGKSFFPQVILHDIIVNLFFVLLIVALAILWHATANGTHSGILGPLYEDKADSAVAIYDPRPDWYYFFLFQLLRVFDNPNLLLLGTIIIPSIWMAILITLPVHRPHARAPRLAPPDRDRLRRRDGRAAADAHVEGLERAQHRGRGDRDRAGHHVREGAVLRQLSHAQGDGLGRQHRPEPRQREAELQPRGRARDERQGADAGLQGRRSPTAQIKCIATVVATLTKGGGSPDSQAVACKGFVASCTRSTRPPARAHRYPARVRFFLGITGASGAPYAARVLAGLTAAGAEVGVCASRAAGEVIAYELYRDRSLDPAEAVRRLVAEHGGSADDAVRRGRLVLALRLGLGEASTAT